jgi:hypothetical protein
MHVDNIRRFGRHDTLPQAVTGIIQQPEREGKGYLGVLVTKGAGRSQPPALKSPLNRYSTATRRASARSNCTQDSKLVVGDLLTAKTSEKHAHSIKYQRAI